MRRIKILTVLLVAIFSVLGVAIGQTPTPKDHGHLFCG